MDDNINFTLGKLTTGVDNIRKDFDDHKVIVRSELQEIKDTLKDLNSWRFKMVGGVTVLSVVAQYVVSKIIKIL